MATIINSLDEELAAKGVVGSYALKPNRLYAKVGTRYRSVDVVSDVAADEVAARIIEAGRVQLNEITTLGQSQVNILLGLEKNYRDCKSNLIQTYTRMQHYYLIHRMEALATIMQTAIINLNNL